MRIRITALALAMALALTGCGWMDGEYVSVVPHEEQSVTMRTDTVSVSNYAQLVSVMEQLVTACSESCVIDVSGYSQNAVERAMNLVCRYIREVYPLGAYAVEEVRYELGTNSGRPAVAVSISYRRSRTEVQRLRKKADMEGVAVTVRTALDDHASRVAVLVDQYAPMDFVQLVRDYARENPQRVMEIPEVSEGIYGTGTSRVVELSFTYQNSREALRQMQAQVRPVFEAAALYVSGEGSQKQKLAQLFSFLMERFDYKQETSITPSYSLLCYGVGDCRAFAEVYAAMCRRAGLECLVVTGTRAGEPWTWNIVANDGYYFHVDLLRCAAEGGFRERIDTEMEGYVWDYSTYPACDWTAPPPETEETEAGSGLS